MFVETLIIGNGFAGRTVARDLKGPCLLVERGEKFNIFERRQRFMQMQADDRHDALIRRSYVSKHAFNTPEELPADCASDYILVDGGCSNHWGGLSFRLSANVFSRDAGSFRWPFDYQVIEPYYREAEQLLRISADPRDPDGRNPLSAIKGVSHWHQALEGYFPQAYIGAQAHNLSVENTQGQGVCMGAGDCELCPMDAKTRSLHIRNDVEVLNEVLVERLHFEGEKAVAAVCHTPKGPLTIRFDRVVVAAHGVESLKLLWRSNLPPGVPQEFMGHYYQDHAVAELACHLPGAKIPFYQVNTAAQVVIPELSGEQDGIEYTTLGLMTPPGDAALAGSLNLTKLNDWSVGEAVADLSGTLSLYVLLEIPPEWDVSLFYEADGVHMDTDGYHGNKHLYDKVIETLYSKMETLGVIPVRAAERRHYHNAFGTHHLVGMLNMADGDNGVVDPDFRLKGSANVYVAGSSLFPRCGSRNPTVTVVALGLMLAEKLNGKP
ncbi:GMC family oxidoreductase [Pseudomonas sp. PDNC002]|uniref:GMC oxidoreductase n=1 Tax=Pseudomonas sp. PDNC002 TaxID=2811422 RepID=UPI001965CDD9|nr:GMC oxidoreductase [Pseudomonas sp. PDNC002]QRY79688.1 GMC family oxidoreductase [Pseudomonas sp. PDNC002]